MGAWLSVYGDAIYGTRPCAPYKKDGICFTKKEDTVYALQPFKEETDPAENVVWIPYTGQVTEVTAMGGRESGILHKGGGRLKSRSGEKRIRKGPDCQSFLPESLRRR